MTGVKGTGWKETVELLRDSFRSTLGYGDHSVCVVITKNRDGIDEIKKNIQKFNPKNAPELSKYAVVYNPLKDNYQELFKTVLSLEAYQQLSSKIKLGESQFKAASKLGADVANAVKKHFEKGTLDQAVPKVQFTHRISSLGCEELEVTHGHVVNVIHTCGAEVIKGMKQNNGTEYRPSIGDAYAEYKLFRHHFSPFVPFKSLDQEVKDIINRVKNPDLFDSTSFTKTGIGALGTCGSLAAATAAVLLSGGAVAVAAAVLGAVTTVGSGWWTWESIKRYWNPSEQEKRKSDFFRQDLN